MQEENKNLGLNGENIHLNIIRTVSVWLVFDKNLMQVLLQRQYKPSVADTTQLVTRPL